MRLLRAARQEAATLDKRESEATATDTARGAAKVADVMAGALHAALCARQDSAGT